MESLAGTLRRVLGRSRFALYAVTEDGNRPVLRAASPAWPPRIDPLPSLVAAGPWREIPAGRLIPLVDLPRIKERWPAMRDLGVLRIGEGKEVLGLLVVQAGERSIVRRIDRLTWVAIGEKLAQDLRAEQHAHSLDSLRRFNEVLLRDLPVGVFTIDRIGRVTFLSPVAAAILGFEPEEAVGSDCLRIFRPVGVEENPLSLGLKGKASRVELYIIDREGKEKPVWLQMSRIRGAGGEPWAGLLVLIRDTSEERAYEEDRARRERLASIGELSAGVAHEIRNPLTGIGNCAQVLRDRIPPDDPRQRFVQIILDEAARLNRIVESLLSFARPGRPRLSESSVTDVVKRVVELQMDRMEQQGVAVETKIRGRIPPIYIDPEQITQVLLNIVGNAIEAMPSGGRLMLECAVIRRRPYLRRGTGQRRSDRIRYDRRTPMRRYVQVCLVDTGRGIPKEAIARIFDPFFTTRPKGTGLGLSISQSIIKEHGGFINVHSVENKGTTVTVDLPVERREGDRRSQPG
jgi:two-component system, NtrC family, sensor histidine kinase AtoS